MAWTKSSTLTARWMIRSSKPTISCLSICPIPCVTKARRLSAVDVISWLLITSLRHLRTFKRPDLRTSLSSTTVFMLPVQFAGRNRMRRFTPGVWPSTWELRLIHWACLLPGRREFSTHLRVPGFSGVAISRPARTVCTFSWRRDINLKSGTWRAIFRQFRDEFSRQSQVEIGPAFRSVQLGKLPSRRRRNYSRITAQQQRFGFVAYQETREAAQSVKY